MRRKGYDDDSDDDNDNNDGNDVVLIFPARSRSFFFVCRDTIASEQYINIPDRSDDIQMRFRAVFRSPDRISDDHTSRFANDEIERVADNV